MTVASPDGLTGDNGTITRTVCRQVGMKVDRIVLGNEIDALSEGDLGTLAEQVNQSRASTPLIVTTIAIVAIGGAIPYTPVGAMLGFVPLPGLYWIYVTAMMLAYAALTHLVKTWFVRRWGM